MTERGVDDPNLSNRIQALNRRFADLSDRMVGSRSPRATELVAELLEELSTAIEELEVSAEEIHAQNEALIDSQHRLDLEMDRYRNLFDLAPDIYLVTDANGVIREANRAATQVLGDQDRGLIGKPVIVFLDPSSRRLALDRLHEAVEQRGDGVVAFETRIAPLHNPAFPASVRLVVGSPVRDGDRQARWIMRDISARVEAELALAASEARYRLLTESSTDVVVIADHAQLITYATPSARGLLAFDPEDLVGRPLEAYVHPDDEGMVAHLREDAWNGARLAPSVWRVRRRNGTYLPVEAQVSQLRDRCGAVVGLRYALRDVHEREEARAQLHEALVRERDAAAVLRRADMAKDALILAASHDLSTPVAAVAGLAEILVQHPDLPEGEIRRVASGLSTTASQLHGIVGNLLDTERVIGGHVHVRVEPIDLAELIHETARTLGLANGIVDLPEVPVTAAVDPGLTARIVDNLLSNAVRHAPPGTTVAVSLTPVENGVLMSVDDDGPGIPDSAKDVVFNAFERLPGHAVGGLGLGLFIVRRFSELQGGRAWVEDRPRGGSSFRVFLPGVVADRSAD